MTGASLLAELPEDLTDEERDDLADLDAAFAELVELGSGQQGA